jgi:hypothetical protein
MTRANRILIILLVAQIGVLVASRLAATRRGPAATRKLFGPERYDQNAVTRVRIVGNDGKTIDLERRGGAWVLASAGGYPALPNKVSELLAKWPNLVGGQPVTTRAEHHRALEVDPGGFQRKITITQSGKPELSFFLGTSAGLKDVHLRFADEPQVYLVKELSAWDAGTAAADWASSEYFKVDRDKIVSLRLSNGQGQIDLTRGADKKWTLAQLEEGQKLKESEVDALLSSASLVTLQDPVGEKTEPRFGLDKPAATLTLVTDPKAQSPYVLSIGAKEGDGYVAKSNGSRFVVRLGTWAAETFLKKKAAELIEQPKKEGEKKDAPAAPDGADAPPPMPTEPG